MIHSIVGVDEVGRGCLAGPVVAGAVIFPMSHIPIHGVDDSKLLSPKKRELLDTIIRGEASYVGIGQVEAEEIDRIGIIAGVSKAMILACKNAPNIKQILVDGPCSLGLERLCPRVLPIVHGDHLEYVIGAASIVAKVYRDKLMSQASSDYPHYGWERNKGYGTKEHLLAIQRYGISPVHRATFVHEKSQRY